MNDILTQTEHGYFSLKNMPSKETLAEFYKEKYFQTNASVYQHTYNTEEVLFFENKAKVAEYIFQHHTHSKEYTLLDVGCGEGFFASYFYNSHWQCTLLDYSSYAIQYHHPKLQTNLMQGDIFNSLENLITQQKEYSLINLSNVLEHLIDPINILEKLKLLLSSTGLLRISVPNDYSEFQKFLLAQNQTTDTWLCPPEHLHYFTFESLSNLLITCGYDIKLQMGEFPIELFLSNETSNYAQDRNKGKFANKARIEVDNFLFSQGIKNYISYYKASANIGLSRQVLIYAQKKEHKK